MKKIILLILVLQITASFTVSKRIESIIKKEICSVFDVEGFSKGGVKFDIEKNKELPLVINETNFFRIIEEGKDLGYYYYGKAYGKADFFDFIVIFDKDLTVLKVKVVAYREDHGGEVGSKRWLKQFIGTTSNQTLVYEKDIAGISGATISVKSMTNEINKLLNTVNILHSQGQI